jgi:hypothetical protein
MTDRRTGIERRDFPRDGEGRRASDRERQRKVDCPFCTHWDSLVLDQWAEGDGFWRKRECQNTHCHQIYLTCEQVRRYNDESHCKAPVS